MDGTGVGSGLTNWTTNMDGTAGGTTAYAAGVPDATSPLQVVALLILFIFPAVALVVVSLRAAGRWAWRQFGWGEFLALSIPFFKALLLMTADDGLIVVAMIMSAIETAASYKCKWPTHRP